MRALSRSAALALSIALSLAAPSAPRAQGAPVSPVPLEGFERGVEHARADARAGAAANAVPAPRLVVALLLDQYRDEYLDRFRGVFGHDGLVRLLDGGARFRDCTIPYAQTLTGPGHATWLSGASPAVHGIAANAWYDRTERRFFTAAGDPDARAVGLPDGVPGEAGSPRWMRAQTVADALRLATLGAGRVVAISDKARGAVLSAGRQPTGAYWLDEDTGRFQTSTWYRSELPEWVVAENERIGRALTEARRTPWERALPAAAYAGTIPGDPRNGFPHPIAEPDDPRPNAVGASSHPFAMNALFEFAEAAIASERLGADDVPDLLILSISTADLVGHAFGPDSPEVLDLAYRLDARLATFLRALDRVVGRGRWAIAVTTDHGVATAPAVAREFAAAPGDSVGGISGARIEEWIDRVVPRALAPVAPRAAGLTHWARSVSSGLVTFDDSLLAVAGVTRAQAARVLADSAGANPWFAAGFAGDDLVAGRWTGALAQRVARGYCPGRSGDVVLVPRPFVFFGAGSPYGTSHGTPYRYDTHVPLVFYGWGVKRGAYWTPVSTFDIAPTVAALLGVDAPAQSEGRVLGEGLALPGPGSR